MNLFTEPRDINLRLYQTDAVERLRNGIREGKRRQILVAPTGAGKTVMAMHLIAESQKKGARAWFIADRNALIDQTSASFADYGIDHGIIQADHPMAAAWKPVQIVSAQTLARRRIRDLPDLIIVDEAHCGYKAIYNLIERCERAKVIGLTATPFTAGMSKHWDHVVNSATTNQLLAMEPRALKPLKIKACVTPDMKDAVRKPGGEFDEDDAGQRGTTIIGDVVNTWIEQSRKFFGGPAKTIVFSPSVKHGAELCRQFAEAGFNFQQISYLDASDDDRRKKIAEFRKPDSAIDGLVSCAVLTRGFDVPDVKIGISCRPYAKSFSSHVQELGRVMRIAPGVDYGLWLCLARGSKVLTDKGLIPIEKITLSDKVWDGENFVPHGGAVCNGVQEVITYQGLTATPGHLVHTSEGWRTFGHCAGQQIPITQTGFGRRPLRLGRDYFARCAVAWAKNTALYPCRVRVRNLWLSVRDFAQQSAERPNQGMPSLQSAGAGISHVALSACDGYAEALQKPERPILSSVWRSWYRVSLQWLQGGDALDHAELKHSRKLGRSGFRSPRTERSLRARKPSLVGKKAQSAQQARASGDCKGSQVSHGASGDQIFRQHVEVSVWGGNDVRSGDRTLPSLITQTQREVWDILDAGPHNRFTCEGLLVHNCHSGNVQRFAEDTAWLYEYGVDTLSDAAKKDSQVRETEEKVKQERFCGSCGMQMEPRCDACPACGWEKPARSEIQIVQGELIDLDHAASGRFKPRQGLRAECLSDPRGIWNAALAYTLANSRKGPDAARKWSMGIWKGIFPDNALPRGLYDAPCVHDAVRPDQWSLVEREVKRFRRTGRRKAA